MFMANPPYTCCRPVEHWEKVFIVCFALYALGVIIFMYGSLALDVWDNRKKKK